MVIIMVMITITAVQHEVWTKVPDDELDMMKDDDSINIHRRLGDNNVISYEADVKNVLLKILTSHETQFRRRSLKNKNFGHI